MFQERAAWALAGWLLGVAAPVLGDVLPPEAAGCSGQLEGGICRTPTGDRGRCVYGSFTRTLPPQPDRPPITQTYQQLVCAAQPVDKGQAWTWILALGVVSVATAAGAAATLVVLLASARKRRQAERGQTFSTERA